VVAARIFNVIGSRETNPHVVPELVEQLRVGRSPVRLGNLEPRRDYTDVRDVAAALHALLSTPDDGPDTFNVGSGRSVSVRDLLQTCEEILGRPVIVESDPLRRRPQERSELLADAHLLQQTTGWRPEHPLRETLSDLLGEPGPS
jgi:UDP-glucose 4-epimerase